MRDWEGNNLHVLEEENRILRNNYKATGITQEDIIDMTGTLIDDKIKSIVHDDSHFPIFHRPGKLRYISYHRYC